MTLQRFAIPPRSSALAGAIVCAILGWASGPACRAPASEVISAIPGNAQPPLTPAMVVDTIEAGTRGPGPAPQHRRPDGCAGGRCSHGHCGHAGCRHGACDVPGCPAHCPVRPASFGFYGTQWRSWPGQEVVQATHLEAVAPVMPPKSEVPSADEESPVPGFELPAPEPEGMDAEPSDRVPGEPGSAEPSLTNRSPAEPARTEPVVPEPAEPAPLPAPQDGPKFQKPAVPAEDNLFDEAAARRRSQERLAMLGQTAVHHARLRNEALRQQVRRTARPVIGEGEPVGAAPPDRSAVPGPDAVGAASPPVVEPNHAEPSPLRQAVHAEPEPRGLRDAVRNAAPGNPLR